LWNPDEIDGHNVCNVRCEPNRHSRIKVEYVKDKINKQETNSKDKNITVDIGDTLAASHGILNRWKN